MSSFASLMALSATHTRESQLAVGHALQERQRRESLQRKQREEREAKERELEKKRRLQMFEEEKRQEQKVQRMEAERRAMEAARERKEEMQKNVLLYGAKKAAKMIAGSSPKYPMSTAAKEAAKRRSGGDSDGDVAPGLALTREELRQRKRDIELKKQFAATKKHTSPGHRRHGQLPGGAVNIVVNANGESVTPVSAVADIATGKSLKERLTQGPNTLVLLQTKARDRRTVDEAQQDIRIKLGKATSKVLSGEEARTFDDWFGSSKDKEKYPTKGSPAPRSSSTTPVPTPSSSSRSAITPTPGGSASSSQKKASSSVSRPSSTKRTPLATPPDKESSLQFSKRNKISKAPPTKSSTSQHSLSSNFNKSSGAKLKRPRSRSLSRSESPPPKRWREDEASHIWEMVTGKPKSAYAMRDIDSDDDDMEADAFCLETEERVSSRIALKEDMLALEEQRRHEEEKRHRKIEKQRTLGWAH